MKDKNRSTKSKKLIQRFKQLKADFINNYPSIRNKAIVFFIFVVLSSLLWFYRALDDTFIANIYFPVHYQNLPKNKILVSTPPEKILLRVKGNGYDLLSNKIKFKTPLNFNINSFLLYSQTNDSMSVYILTRYAREALTEELNKKNANLEIVSISPDSLFFSFTRTKSKRIAVIASIIITDNIFAKQYMQNGSVLLSPDSVEIIGPATIIDTINYIYTKAIQPTELRDTLKKKLKLNKPNQVLISKESTQLTIPVDKYTEISYTIPVLSRYVPDSINMKLFPSDIKLSFNITHSYIAKINATDFRPYVDYNILLENTNQLSNRIKVKVDSVPPFIHAIRMYPSSVEFINELNNVDSRNNGRNR